MKFTGERYIPDNFKFSEIAIEHMSRYLALVDVVKDKIVLDAASGEGYGSFLISKYAREVVGIDISAEAISFSNKNYKTENLKYIQSDIKEIPTGDNYFDIVVSFETIEHVDEETQHLFLNEVKRVLKKDGILVISTPNKSVYNKFISGYHNEFHVKEFEVEEFKKFLEKYFSNFKHFDQNFQTLNVITNNMCEEFKYLKLDNSNLIESKYIISLCSDFDIGQIDLNSITQSSINEYNEKIDRIFTLQDQIEEAGKHIKKMYKDIIERDSIIFDDKETIEILNAEIERINKEIVSRDDIINNLNKNVREVSTWAKDLDKDKSKLLKDNTDYILKISQLSKELLDNIDTLEEYSQKVSQLEKNIKGFEKEIEDREEKIYQLEENINGFEKSIEDKEGKIYQLEKSIDCFEENMEENKKKIFQFEKDILDKNLEIDELKLNISNKHEELMAFSDWGKSNQDKLTEVIENYSILSHEMSLIKASDFWKWANRYYKIRDNVWPFSWIFRKIKKRNLEKKHTRVNSKIDFKDKLDSNEISNFPNKKINILYFSIIDYNFRTQRPQHIANNLSKLGNYLHYFNANFLMNKNACIVENLENDLNIITLNNLEFQRVYDLNKKSDFVFIYGQIKKYLLDLDIKDGIIVCNYPNWYPVLELINKEFGFEVIFDFLDDFTGFNTNMPDLKYFTDKMFSVSRKVIATSDFLFDKAKQYHEDVTMIRNGTDFKFFNEANVYIEKERPIIGYYGAIAEWFDMNLVINIAKRRPEYDLVLIGDYSYADVSELTKCQNVKLLGEMDYKALPQWLIKFDVCLIPFDASTDLIKATNPVKFYEYLSAGKNIVATEIPELMPYKDKFVFLTNDTDEFLRYVDLCLRDKDCLGDKNEKIEFAKLQDWNERAKNVSDIICDSFEKVSIIIVTYNNRGITEECINSILDKTIYPNYEIIIVDNLSTDSTRDYLKELDFKYDRIRIILNDENYGFAKGNNIGLAVADGEYLVLLNNDTVVTNGWLSGLIKHLKSNKNLGMLGPVTNSIGNEAQINIQYKSIKEMDDAAKTYTDEHLGELYNDINVLAMFCVIFKRELFGKTGYLDEIYGIGMFEDDDYSNTIKKLGYEVACAEDVFIHHYGSVSFKKLEDEKYRKIFEENKLKYESKWGKKWIPHKYRKGVN